jgi:hypothetical protein
MELRSSQQNAGQKEILLPYLPDFSGTGGEMGRDHNLMIVS